MACVAVAPLDMMWLVLGVCSARVACVAVCTAVAAVKLAGFTSVR